MANNSNNDDFPTIRLDDEDRRDYQKKASAFASQGTFEFLTVYQPLPQSP